MKINAAAIMRVAPVRCFRDSPEGPLEARITFITEDNVMGARRIAELDPSVGPHDAGPDVRYGSVLAFTKKADGIKPTVLSPGMGDDFRLPDGTAFLGTNMLKARETLISMGDLDENQKNALAGIQSIFEMVSVCPDESRFPVHLIAQAYQSAITDAFGHVDIPVDQEDFVRKAQADIIRARIAHLDPENPDGLGATTDFIRMLDRAGADVRLSGSGASVRSSGNIQITSREARKMILANDRLNREVFGAITRTPIENLDVAVLSIEDAEAISDRLKDRRLKGPWLDEMEERVRNITGSGMGSYRFDISLYVSEGRDLLVVSDNVGRSHGVAFAYAWPSTERSPKTDRASGSVLNISPQDIPTQDEVIRLRSVLADVEFRSRMPHERADPDLLDG